MPPTASGVNQAAVSKGVMCSADSMLFYKLASSYLSSTITVERRLNILEASIKEEYAEDTVGAEQCPHEALHVLGLEEVGGKQRCRRDPSLNIHGRTEEEKADDECHEDIGVLPAVWRTTPVCNGEGNEH